MRYCPGQAFLYRLKIALIPGPGFYVQSQRRCYLPGLGGGWRVTGLAAWPGLGMLGWAGWAWGLAWAWLRWVGLASCLPQGLAAYELASWLADRQAIGASDALVLSWLSDCLRGVRMHF